MLVGVAAGNVYVNDATMGGRFRKITAQAVSASLTDLTPGTTYYFRAVAINEAGLSYGNVQSFTAIPLTAVWQAAHFTFSELLDPQISGWTASPDNDELNNLQEFAFGTDPRSAGSGGVKICVVFVIFAPLNGSLD